MANETEDSPQVDKTGHANKQGADLDSVTDYHEGKELDITKAQQAIALLAETDDKDSKVNAER